MPNLPYLDVAIGLFFVYLVLSLLASAIGELVEAVLRTRAKYLAQSVKELLGGSDAELEAFYEHPAINGLFFGTYKCADRPAFLRRLPSYIPSANFAIALIDRAIQASADGGGKRDGTNADAGVELSSIERLRRGVANNCNATITRTLQSIMRVSGDDIQAVQQGVEALYETTQDRVTGWYKRHSRMVLLAVGFGLAVGVNADTYQLVKYLAEDAAARRALIDAAGDYLSSEDAASLPDPAEVGKYLGSLTSGPIGNARQPFHLGVLGWILTACAVSLGAPFWYDLLSKLVPIRASLKPHNRSGAEAGGPAEPTSFLAQRPDGG